MRQHLHALLAAVTLTAATTAAPLGAQRGGRGGTPTVFTATADDPLAALRFRSVGPVVSSGRLADVAIDPKNHNIWYVATASGGLWKTTDHGLDFTPVFDHYGSYSMCCVLVDPKNSNVVWLATGEMTNPRSAMAGDGVYKSVDAGATWKRVGLERSEKIGRMAIDPRNSDIVYVASEGPLWAAGGDRGLFKTTDGGATWTNVLHPSENTGVSDIVLDPRNPDAIVVAAYQRRRNVGVLIGGGPEGGIFKSSDGGATWRKLTSGTPKGDMGRIGLAVSPHDPNVLYAQITAQGNETGFYRSPDFGETWVHESNWNSGDPQYYGRLFPDPFHFDRVCDVEVAPRCTNDGGKTTQPLPLQGTHTDHHYLWFDPTDSLHWLDGDDGGLYESYNGGANWRHFDNLPTLQYYRIATDNAAPFYTVYGGAQDNEMPGTPSRSASPRGIRSAEGIDLPGGDGFQARVDPIDPTIVYVESQNGAMERADMITGQTRNIAPPRKLAGATPADSETTRAGWDVPYIISPHNRARLYVFTSHVFRSDNRGDSWTSVSGDLTRHLDRDTMTVMGRKWGPDAVTRNLFTTDLSVGTSLDESPLAAGLLYAGTDDGMIQVTENGGTTWRKIDAFPGVPAFTGVSAVLASKHDTNVVYASFNNQWQGDFTPYVLKSTDRGRTWTSIRGNLPDREQVWTLAEDYANAELLFAGTEHGVYVTVDGGQSWRRLQAGLPTVAVRSIELQRRENDLVLGTFGRGIYIMDDYSALRTLASPAIAKAAGTLFPPRATWLYDEIPFRPGDAGNGELVGQNPPYGALVTYSLAHDEPPGTEVVVRITNATGSLVSEVCGPTTAGLSRVVWNMHRTPAPAASAAATPGRGAGRGAAGSAGGAGALPPGCGGAGAGGGRGGAGGGAGGGRGPAATPVLVPPGTYMVQLESRTNGALTPIGPSQRLQLVSADVTPHIRSAPTASVYSPFECVP